jgi:hypothetical protein
VYDKLHPSKKILTFVAINPLITIKMDKLSIKTAMLSALSEEIDLWLDKKDSIQNGYDYETEFINVARKVNNILLSKSLGSVSTNRNKKKTSYLLRKV